MGMQWLQRSKLPGKGHALPAARKLVNNCAFRYRETTDFDCHRVQGTSLRAGFAPDEVERPFRAHFIANKGSGASGFKKQWNC
jgi:hypothetical protein